MKRVHLQIVFNNPSLSSSDYNRDPPVVKQWPLSYVRTYTYHPVQFPTQTAAPISSFQVSRYLPNFFSANSPPKALAQTGSASAPAPASPSSMGNIQQPASPSSVPPPAPPVSHSQAYAPAQGQQPNPNAMPMPSQLPVNQQSSSDFNQPMPVQIPSQSSFFGSSHMAPKPMQYMQDPASFPYMPSVAPYNVQHVQFVPCMCPITVSMPPEVEKRADDTSAIENQNTVDDNWGMFWESTALWGMSHRSTRICINYL